MSTIVIVDVGSIPDGITDLDSFRHWAYSDEFPDSGGISFLNGEIWLDVFDRSFRYERRTDPLGNPEFSVAFS
jgi:hypothetical protein